MRRWIEAAWLGAAWLGCSPRASGGGVTGGDAAVVGLPPASSCLPNVTCAVDTDCPRGHRCNLALPPPACEVISCGAEGSNCSDDANCQPTLRCWQQVCTRCNGCGDLCLVDFQTSSLHCGRCNNPVAAGTVCVNGQPGCPAGRTLCGATCVDLATDPANCGACGVRVPAGGTCLGATSACPATTPTRCGDVCVDVTTDRANCGSCGHAVPATQACVNGQAACPASAADLCAGRCVDLATDPANCGACGARVGGGQRCAGGAAACPGGASTPCGAACDDLATSAGNCGACGHACPAGATCTAAQCRGSVSATVRMSCAALCGARGGACVEGQSSEVCGSGFLPGAVGLTCAQVPAASCNSSGAGPQPFNSVSCGCTY